MTPYANHNGNSGVAGYELHTAGITVYFHGGAAYLYTAASADPGVIHHMKSLAIAGRGLSTFIAQSVKDRYARKFEWR